MSRARTPLTRRLAGLLLLPSAPRQSDLRAHEARQGEGACGREEDGPFLECDEMRESQAEAGDHYDHGCQHEGSSDTDEVIRIVFTHKHYLSAAMAASQLSRAADILRTERFLSRLKISF